MFVDMLHGVSRKTVEIIASLVGMAVVGVLLWGGVVYVMSTYDQESVSTGVNMTFIYGTLPIMAAAALIIQLRDFIALLRRPVSEFEKA